MSVELPVSEIAANNQEEICDDERIITTLRPDIVALISLPPELNNSPSF